jgi:membrane protein DedA with SNARE-associated domain
VAEGSLVPVKELLFWLVKPFLVLVAAGFGLAPIPEEIIVTYAGIDTAGETRFGPYRWLMLPTCILGAFLADVVLYSIGRRYGAWLLEHRWFARIAPAKKREQIRENFNRYGVVILVIGRVVPGIRATLFMTAGMMRLPIARFCLADGLGAVLGNSLFFLLGFWLGHQFGELIQNLEKRVSVAQPLLIFLALVGLAAYLVYLFVRRPIPTGDPEELPLIGHQVAAHLPTKPTAEDDKRTRG